VAHGQHTSINLVVSHNLGPLFTPPHPAAPGVTHLHTYEQDSLIEAQLAGTLEMHD